MGKLKTIMQYIKLRKLWASKYGALNSTWPGCLFDESRVKVGRYSYGKINAQTYNCEGSELIIGNFCSLSTTVTFLLGGEHTLGTISTFPFAERILRSKVDTISKGTITIDDDVWIGEHTLILSGVHINQGAVIAAGAVVNRDVEENCLVAGVPAKVIRKIDQNELL